MKKIYIQLTDESIKELWDLKQKLKIGYPFEEKQTYEEFYKEMKSKKLGALFG